MISYPHRPPIENWTMIGIDRWPVYGQAAIDWCHEHFDNRDGETATWLYYTRGQFEFEHEEDAMLFALRWS
jgi:hypothetical protein